MKKYEFINHATQKSAEVHTDIAGYEGAVFVVYKLKGHVNCSLKGTSGTGEKEFKNEDSAIKSAKSYVTKGE